VKDALRLSGGRARCSSSWGSCRTPSRGRSTCGRRCTVVGGGILLLGALASNLAGVRRTVAARGTRERAQGGHRHARVRRDPGTLNVVAARFPKSWDATNPRSSPYRRRPAPSWRRSTGGSSWGRSFPRRPRSRRRRGSAQAIRRRSPKLSFRFVDAEKEPQLADRFGVTRSGVLAARAGDDKAQTGGDAAGRSVKGTSRA